VGAQRALPPQSLAAEEGKKAGLNLEIGYGDKRAS